MDCFDDMADLDRFFLRLQAITGARLVNRKSAIIFDEVQHIFSQKDVSNDGETLFMPIYMLPFLLEE